MESNFEWITANGDIGIRFFHSIDDGPRHVPMGFTSGLNFAIVRYLRIIFYN